MGTLTPGGVGVFVLGTPGLGVAAVPTAGAGDGVF